MSIADDLKRAIDWANERLRSGAEPPWSYYRLMQLKEAAAELLEGMRSTQPMEGSQESLPHSASEIQPSASVLQLDTARRHQPGSPVRLPT
jgi:hypothetical protein